MEFGPNAYPVGIKQPVSRAAMRAPLNFFITSKVTSHKDIVFSVQLPTAGSYKVQMFDVSGRVLWEKKANGVAGANEIVKQKATNQMSTGLYWSAPRTLYS